MDFVSCSQTGRVIPLLLCLCLASQLLCQDFPIDADPIATVKNLYAEKRWEEIVRFPSSNEYPAELDLYRGLALAQLQRWTEAKAAFKIGQTKAPHDKRFPLELAGVAYRRKHLSEAKADLNQALRLDPGDVYARDFLASTYLLEGNLEAALRHWNRIGKPKITDLKFDPQPRVRAALLDRAFAFSPMEILHGSDLMTTKARIENMEIFPRYRFELLPDQGESFSVLMRSLERNGWGDGKLDGILATLRGLPYQAIQPEFYNLNRSSINIRSMLRWDAPKRRFFASLSSPLEQEPQRRFELYLDGRDERWDIRNTSAGNAFPQTDIKLQKAELGMEIRSIISGSWAWSTGISFSYRKFGNLTDVAPPATPFFTKGFSLKYRAGLEHKLLELPEQRLVVTSSASGQFGKLFARPLGTFGRIDGSLEMRWLPLPRGDDYEMRSRLRTGAIAGLVPLDEFFILGIERDNDLWLRGHVGTTDGKKGSAPMGRRFVLWNWEADKDIYRNGFVTVKLGPFLDVGKIADSSGVFGSNGWLWDPGVQSKVRVLGGFTVVVSYGKDLRSGRTAFYTTVSR